VGTSQLLSAYGQVPLSFEANQGQADSRVNFLARGNGYALFLTPGQAVLSLHQPAEHSSGQAPSGPAAAGDVLAMQFLGANANPRVTGLDEQAGVTNYLIGNDPAQWHMHIANYGTVQYQGLYPGIDLNYYGNQRQLEYDFVVAPGADPRVIHLAFQGARSLALNDQGNLVLHTAGGDVVEHAPVLYQECDGGRQAVSGHYLLEGDGRVGFAVGRYDSSRTLTIDPILSYSTYFGGPTHFGNNAENIGLGIAVDGAGNTYVTGYTTATDLPTLNPIQGTSGGGAPYLFGDAFVMKLNASGNALVYSTYLGGSGDDSGQGIAVDAAGNAYVTGYTTSTDFPTANALQAANGGGRDGFVAKLNAAGTALVYSTYLGGSGDEFGRGIVVDAAGNAYVTGDTSSTDFPTANPLQAGNGGGSTDAFVAKLNGAGTALVYSTYLGGSGDDSGQGIAVDAAGNTYVTGYTTSTDFPTANSLQPANAGGYDAFVAKLNAAGTTLVYSTYLGGSHSDFGTGIALDAAGNAYVTGYTASVDFPTVNPFQATTGSTYPFDVDAFVTKINASGQALVYSTYLGGNGLDEARAIAVDGAGNAYVTGYTDSADFPTVDPFQKGPVGGYDVFVTELNAPGTALVFSSYLGGSTGSQFGNAIAVDSCGNAYVTGDTGACDFPIVNPFQGPSINPADYAFISKIVHAATHFRISAPASTTAGLPFSITVTALDANNQPVRDYAGTVHIASTDASAILPANYTFVSGDLGTHTFTRSVILTKAGSRTVTATDIVTSTITGTSTVRVQAAPANRFTVAGLSTTTAGKAFTIMVTAWDRYGNLATGFLGTIHFTSTDSQAVLPSDYTFQAGDHGKHVFTNQVVLKTVGSQHVTATDTTNGSITGLETTKVNPSNAFLFLVKGFPTSATAGVAYTFTVTALDAYGNVATGYRGTVHFTSSDTKAILPADYTFAATDKGKHSFSATLNTFGLQSLAATDTLTSSITGMEGGITVS
jgi:hypothetical protein